jgi:hypothetical protein
MGGQRAYDDTKMYVRRPPAHDGLETRISRNGNKVGVVTRLRIVLDERFQALSNRTVGGRPDRAQSRAIVEKG